MTLIKWKTPNHTVRRETLFPEMPSIFDDFLNMRLFGRDFAAHMPAVNISEEEKQFVIEMSAPGFNKEDIKLEIEDFLLTVKGEQKVENNIDEKNYSRKEFSYGSFSRSFTLPENANAEKIEAKYENGIMKLLIPKKEEEQKKTIREIKIN
jgi:HSP20 family protein